MGKINLYKTWANELTFINEEEDWRGAKTFQCYSSYNGYHCLVALLHVHKHTHVKNVQVNVWSCSLIWCISECECIITHKVHTISIISERILNAMSMTWRLIILQLAKSSMIVPVMWYSNKYNITKWVFPKVKVLCLACGLITTIHFSALTFILRNGHINSSSLYTLQLSKRYLFKLYCRCGTRFFKKQSYRYIAVDKANLILLVIFANLP